MLQFKSINFRYNRPKIKLLLQKKMQNLQALGALPPDPIASGCWGVWGPCPQTPKGILRQNLPLFN